MFALIGGECSVFVAQCWAPHSRNSCGGLLMQLWLKTQQFLICGNAGRSRHITACPTLGALHLAILWRRQRLPMIEVYILVFNCPSLGGCPLLAPLADCCQLVCHCLVGHTPVAVTTQRPPHLPPHDYNFYVTHALAYQLKCLHCQRMRQRRMCLCR